MPQGHEVEAPDRLRVVARGPAPALRARRAGPGAGTYPDLDAQPRVLHQPHRLIDERRVLLDSIQDTLELHSVPLPRRLDVVQHPLSWIPERNALPMSRPRCVIAGRVVAPLRRSKPRSSGPGAVSDGPPRQPGAALRRRTCSQSIKGQPSGWPQGTPARSVAAVHPKDRSVAEDPRSGLTAGTDRAW